MTPLPTLTPEQEAKIKKMRSLSPIFTYFGEHPAIVTLLGYNPHEFIKSETLIESENPCVAVLESVPGRMVRLVVLKMHSDRDDGLIGEYNSVADAEDDFFTKIPSHPGWENIFNVNQCLTKVASMSRRGRANTILCNAKTVKKEFGKFKVVETIGRWKKIDITFREWGHLKSRANFYISDDMPDNQLICVYVGSNYADAGGGLVKTKDGVLLYGMPENENWFKYTNYAIKITKKEETKCQPNSILLHLKNYWNVALMTIFKR